MHNYKTDQIVKLLNITIVVILVLGFLAGIGYGGTQMKLSDDASEAMMKAIELRTDRYSSLHEDELAELDKKATEKKWTFESTISMIVVWVISAIVAVLFVYKKYHIEMLDEITWRLEKQAEGKIE